MELVDDPDDARTLPGPAKLAIWHRHWRGDSANKDINFEETSMVAAYRNVIKTNVNSAANRVPCSVVAESRCTTAAVAARHWRTLCTCADK